jgi:hypothetical protein
MQEQGVTRSPRTISCDGCGPAAQSFASVLLRVTILGRVGPLRRGAYDQRRTGFEHIAGFHDDHSRTTMNVTANGLVDHSE